jgi:hypothetical protein
VWWIIKEVRGGSIEDLKLRRREEKGREEATGGRYIYGSDTDEV